MIRRLLVAGCLAVACVIANGGQEMPQQMWWDIYQTYQYLSNGPASKLEQRQQKWADMNDGQRDAATPEAVRQRWMNMSLDQRHKAADEAWAWNRAHQ